jgi:hypothetical protein
VAFGDTLASMRRATGRREPDGSLCCLCLGAHPFHNAAREGRSPSRPRPPSQPRRVRLVGKRSTYVGHTLRLCSDVWLFG